eukprot:2012688-Amphidinium_carterae.1
MELCEGHLQWFRSSRGPGEQLDVSAQVELMANVGAGCSWIAERKMVHRDLKMQNILMAKALDAEGNEKHVPKIADFGLAQRSTNPRMGVAGTRAYMAPEAYSGHFSEKSDVYSFGLVMLRTFCPTKTTDDIVDIVEGRVEAAACLLDEWRSIDNLVQEQHCKDAADYICT